MESEKAKPGSENTILSIVIKCSPILANTDWNILKR